jgi:hypothetical protein
MGQNLNSSGARDRFTLASTGIAVSRTYSNEFGANYVDSQLEVDQQAKGSMTIVLETSQDGVSFSGVGSSVTVVPCGTAPLAGAVGNYFRFRVTAGNDQIMVVAQFTNVAQLVGAPS